MVVGEELSLQASLEDRGDVPALKGLISLFHPQTGTVWTDAALCAGVTQSFHQQAGFMSSFHNTQ